MEPPYRQPNNPLSSIPPINPENPVRQPQASQLNQTERHNPAQAFAAPVTSTTAHSTPATAHQTSAATLSAPSPSSKQSEDGDSISFPREMPTPPLPKQNSSYAPQAQTSTPTPTPAPAHAAPSTSSAAVPPIQTMQRQMSTQRNGMPPVSDAKRNMPMPPKPKKGFSWSVVFNIIFLFIILGGVGYAYIYQIGPFAVGEGGIEVTDFEIEEPPLPLVSEIEEKMQTQLTNVQMVRSAIANYVEVNQENPANLELLTIADEADKNYLSEIPIDQFTGQPLVYTLNENFDYMLIYQMPEPPALSTITDPELIITTEILADGFVRTHRRFATATNTAMVTAESTEIQSSLGDTDGDTVSDTLELYLGTDPAVFDQVKYSIPEPIVESVTF